MSEVIHILKNWEKKYGYLNLSPEELKLFKPVIDKRFDLKVGNERSLNRKIDSSHARARRLYVSPGPLSQFEVGDKLIIGKDSKGNYYVVKNR